LALTIKLFEPQLIALSEEITYHPKLQEILQWPENSNLDATDKLVTIASYCQIEMRAGFYTEQELLAIADLCVQKLRKMRSEIIIVS
jgi:hypothetical protein